VRSSERETVYAYLRERELVTDVYHERHVGIELADGRKVNALAFVVDRSHEQYAGRPAPEQIAEIVARASGKAGDNREYVANTLAHLRGMNIVDHQLEAVGRLLGLAG
jgi:cation transport protein ChaC